MRPAHRLCLLTAAAAFPLLVAGGLVTSTGSGMASPDPVRIDGFSGTKLYEHGHRVLGWLVGILAFASVLAVGIRERRPWVRRLAVGALAAVAAQGLLGMLTVKLQLAAPAVSILHAGVAQITFSLFVALALVTSPRYRPFPPDPRGIALLAALFLQILCGATYRHTGSGAALAAHVIGVLLVGGFAFLARSARIVHVLFFVQLLLGPLSLALTQGKRINLNGIPEPLIRALPITAHVAVGALLMAAAVVWLVRPPTTVKETEWVAA